MKKHLVFFLLFICVNAVAQKAAFNENSVTYSGLIYRVGSIVHLGYGSANNKDFAFVNYGKSVGGLNLPGLYHHADVNWSKADVEIEKIEKKSGVVWLRCKPIDKGTSVGSILGSRIYINLEGAVDNKEIKGVEAKTNNSTAETHTNNSAPSPASKELAAAPSPKSTKQSSQNEKPVKPGGAAAPKKSK
jgi:hypothetical protein